MYEFVIDGPQRHESFFQRWSKIQEFPKQVAQWCKAQNITGQDAFTLSIRIRYMSTSDAASLDYRRVEIANYFNQFNKWVDRMVQLRKIQLSYLLSDGGPINNCLAAGLRDGMRSTLRESGGQMLSADSTQQQGWLNVVHRKGKEFKPYFVMLAHHAVNTGEGSSAGTKMGTLAVYEGQGGREATKAIELQGAFVSEARQNDTGSRSPRSMRHMSRFTVVTQMHQVAEGRFESIEFGAGEVAVVTTWVAKCHAAQAQHFPSWSTRQLHSFMTCVIHFDSALELSGSERELDRPVSDVAKMVKRHRKDTFHQMMIEAGYTGEAIDQIWLALTNMMVQDGLSDAAAGEASLANIGPYMVHAVIAEEGKIGLTIECNGENHPLITHIRPGSIADGHPLLCTGMKLIKMKGDSFGTLAGDQLDNETIRKRLKKKGRPLTLVFERDFTWQKHTDASTGQDYYYNAETEESSWDEPEEIRLMVETAKQRRALRVKRKNVYINHSSPWTGYTDYTDPLSGKHYFARQDTDQSVWEAPREGICTWADADDTTDEEDLAHGMHQAKRDQDQHLIPTPPPCDGTLHVTVVRAIDVIGADLPTLGGERTSDPYAKLSMTTMGSTVSQKTSVHEKTIDPVWGDLLSFPIKKTTPLVDMLIDLEVYDQDTTTGDDFLGMCELNIPELMSLSWDSGQGIDHVVQLSDPQNQVSRRDLMAKQQLMAKRMSSRSPAKSRKQGLELIEQNNAYGAVVVQLRFKSGQGVKRPGFAGKLKIRSIECSDLIPANSNGLSDPFVIMKMSNPEGKESKRTTSVENDSLHPRWHEDKLQSCDFERPFRVDPTQDVTDLVLKVEVWDRNDFMDDFLGGCEVNLCSEFEDGWTNGARITAHSMLRDPENRVQEDDICRALRQRKGVRAEDIYGAIKVEMDFVANSNQEANSEAIDFGERQSKAGQMSVEVTGARGPFIPISSDLLFEISAAIGAHRVSGGQYDRPVPTGAERQVLQIRPETVRLNSPQRPDTVTIRVKSRTRRSDSAIGYTEKEIARCEIDVRHKVPDQVRPPYSVLVLDC